MKRIGVLLIGFVLIALCFYFGKTTGLKTDIKSNITPVPASSPSVTSLSAPSFQGYLVPKPIFKSRQDKYDVINKFSADVQVSYFRQLLGEPVYINYSEDSYFRELIFVDPDFYVQLITDPNQKVLSYAVTSRNKDFNPPVGRFYDEKVVYLNQTKFGDIPEDTFGSLMYCHLFKGNTAPSYYFEEYTSGYPRLYQTVYFGINSAGYFSGENLPGTTDLELADTVTCNEIDQSTRKNLTFNTYMVSLSEGLPIGMDDDDSFIYGPRFPQVGTLNE